MPSVEKISIALTKDLAALVRQAVEDGEYASTSEVIREALRDWKIKRTLQQEQVEELRRLLNEGPESGPWRFADMDGMIREARRRLKTDNGKA